MKKLTFLFGIHNHQPVGNFDYVLDMAYEKAYLPFIEVLNRHPKIKMGIHFSGYLFEYIAKHHPHYIETLKSLVQRGQLEFLTGGYYEPIMSVIPDTDKIGQIEKLTKFVKETVNYKPKGMWLAERVWEPQIAKPLVQAGIEYVVVDDIHFKNAGLYDEDLTGYYVTEELGYPLKVFPISKYLRYTIPYEPTKVTFDYFRKLASDDAGKCIMMFDDGEKFGVWPGTHKHVYEEGWLEEFFTLLEENADWITMMTPSEYISLFSSLGRVYLPIGSYMEMTEWALPTRARKEFEELVNSSKGKPEENFLKGGIWRNFLSKYTEANNIHKKALYVSRKLIENPSKEALDECWQGEANDAYWHGVFGGLYLPHLRHALYTHLINAEKYLDEKKEKGWNRSERVDYNADGKEETLLSSEYLNLYFEPGYGGRLFELDYKPSSYNVLNTLMRRYEPYHDKLKYATYVEDLSESDKAKSIHNLILAKEKDMEKMLVYDWYEKYAMIDHFLGDRATLENFQNGSFPEQGDFVNQPYEIAFLMNNAVKMTRDGHVWVGSEFLPLSVSKTIETNKNVMFIHYDITNTSIKDYSLKFANEYNFFFLSANSEDRGIEFKDGIHAVSDTLEFDTNSVKIFSKPEHIRIRLELGEKTLFWFFPIYTISFSEEGFEKVYQESSLIPIWQFVIRSGETKQFDLRIIIES